MKNKSSIIIILIVFIFLAISIIVSADCVPTYSYTNNSSSCCNKSVTLSLNPDYKYYCLEVGSTYETEPPELNTTKLASYEPILEEALTFQFAQASQNSPLKWEEDLFLDQAYDAVVLRIDWTNQYIAALIYLAIDGIKLIFYLIEIRIAVWFFLTMVPNIFFKIRDMLIIAFVQDKK